MRKIWIVVCVVIISFLSGCTGSTRLGSILDSSHYRVGFALETHFEMGIPMNIFYLVHHDGNEFFMKGQYVYYPQSDGTTIVVDTSEQPKKGYVVKLGFDFPEINVRDLHDDVEGHTYKSALLTRYKTYRGEDYSAHLFSKDDGELHYFIGYQDEEYIYEYEEISSNDNPVPNYQLSSDEDRIELFTSFNSFEMISDSEFGGIYQGFDVRIDLLELYAYIDTGEDSYRWDLTKQSACFTFDDGTLDCNDIIEGNVRSAIKFKVQDELPEKLRDEIVELGQELVEMIPVAPRIDVSYYS